MNDSKDEKEEISESNQTIFPNLSDADLRRLGLWVQSPSEDNSESLIGEENIESKYTSLVLAFKTDKMTLTRRLELQNKLRDQAEINMTHEVEALKAAVDLLNNLCTDIERNDLFEKIRHTIEALYNSALRVSSTAEIYGAVQQENRLSKAIDIILKYVENLKHLYEKEKNEHEETRKLLRESKTPATTPTENSKRRASIATLHQRQIQTEVISTSGERRGSSSRRGSQLRRSTLTKNDSQNEILRNNGNEGESFDKIFEGCETCGSRLKSEQDSNTSHPNSSDESSAEEPRVLKRGTSFKEEGNVARRSTPRHKFRKRSSFTSPLWLQKMSKYWHWLRPYEDYALQVRYFIASLFVLAAFFVMGASFFQSVEA
ncbi:unnamed protein product [Nezara viridula]|uniref:Lymphoid-restricted membrane protein-like n=1 Tax=Nezara viridula TaxID=85310 RepID=A0A9P0HER9_NEZVI|nr:unnamed protein product [Nezara viridula]